MDSSQLNQILEIHISNGSLKAAERTAKISGRNLMPNNSYLFPVELAIIERKSAENLDLFTYQEVTRLLSTNMDQADLLKMVQTHFAEGVKIKHHHCFARAAKIADHLTLSSKLIWIPKIVDATLEVFLSGTPRINYADDYNRYLIDMIMFLPESHRSEEFKKVVRRLIKAGCNDPATNFMEYTHISNKAGIAQELISEFISERQLQNIKTVLKFLPEKEQKEFREVL